MINGDDSTSFANTSGVDLDSRRRERSVDIVNRNGIVRICGATMISII